MVAVVTAIGGLIGLIVSLVFLAMQTRSVSEQFRMASNVNGINGIDLCLNSLREIYFKMMDFPGLRQHFYDDVPCPESGVERERVLLLAEMLTDVLERGLVATRRIPETESFDDWRDYCLFILEHSPTICDLLLDHPKWWPELVRLHTA
ncbi:hypothetical protein KUF83_08080 [Streptomyces sp. BV286]|uniref:hypothetical protein n=1 Tax=Streptomyces sp. BV286 TaxID=2849672 RepID=UPI001C2E58C4|nr:hypothetical protein [Streptomyces sp. BV286]MBV1936522.1 hypothetical protein [Streptomyces sp. BV286]